jgi:hypothetical protein
MADVNLLEEIPAAHGIGIVMCPDPQCGRPHIVLFDEDEEAIAHFILDAETFAILQDAMALRVNN